MTIRRSFALLLLCFPLAMPALVTAEMWRCATPDGTEIYTNLPKEYQKCVAYEPVSELGVFSRVPAIGVAPRLLQVEPVQPPERTKLVEESPVPSDMSFEVFRMLSIGMPEAEVLARAGSPTYISSLPLTGGPGLIAPVSNALRYSYIGDWIVVVEFDRSGRVSNLNRFRPRP
ncbi:MAG TPA: hypothetical protein VGJ57_10845 [Nitrospirales bacterium]|jgi:hypothetical protein